MNNIIEVGYFKLARNVSKNSSYKIKVGAVIVMHGKPISVGFNCQKSHPLRQKGHACVHAEINALINAGSDVEGGIIYVYRERSDESPGLARPCNYCYQKLMDAGIKKLIYTTYSGYAIERI